MPNVPQVVEPAGETPRPHGGRPSIYTPDLAASILDGLRRTGNLRRVCRGEGMPDESTVRAWATADPDGFGKAYREARDVGLDAMADETIDIADDSRNDTQVGEDGKQIVDFDHIQRSRLRVDTRKWYLSKLAPKRYGDTARIEHTGADGGPIETKSVDALEHARMIAFALAEAARRLVAGPGDDAKVIEAEDASARPGATSGD